MGVHPARALGPGDRAWRSLLCLPSQCSGAELTVSPEAVGRDVSSSVRSLCSSLHRLSCPRVSASGAAEAAGGGRPRRPFLNCGSPSLTFTGPGGPPDTHGLRDVGAWLRALEPRFLRGAQLAPLSLGVFAA